MNIIYITITEQNRGIGQRIDNFLLRKLKNIPKDKIYNILRQGEVRVNKCRIKHNYKLQKNDIIRIPQLVRFEIKKNIQKNTYKISILYEDENLMILNKSPGLAVHGGTGLNFGLIELLRAQHPNQTGLELVHRLDRDTSGCIIIAKNHIMLRELHNLLKTGNILKIYHCLVFGHTQDKFKVKVNLCKTLSSGKKKINVHPIGKVSITHFSVLTRYNNTALLKAIPVTGRTHQIRVHAAYKNLPIIGDTKYGIAYNAKRMFLHARQLSFTCPISKKEIIVTAEYDKLWHEGILYYGRQ